MNKVIVTKEMPIGETPFFRITVNGETKHIIHFQTEALPDSLYGEERNRNEAMKVAKMYEAGIKRKPQIIYQTPE